MKVSRSAWKNECNRTISIAFAAAMLAVCIVPALASATFIPPDPLNLVNTTDDFGANYTWQAGSEWYLISGGDTGVFHGFDHADSMWQGDGGITSGLGDIGMNSAPTVFQKDGTWYLISGETNGSFHGFNRTGSTWQRDSAITSGLGDIGVNSAPTVFDPGNVTDSYNVSINGDWRNDTKETFADRIPPNLGGWANITVWAWNASGAGTLSAGCVSDNVQVTREEGLGDTFVLVGSVPNGGREGTYPPGWFETPTPTPTATVTVTATKAPAASAANASVDVAQAQPGESITPPPRATDQTQATVPAADATPTKPKQGLPGFTASFAGCGVLVAAYAVMRRRR